MDYYPGFGPTHAPTMARANLLTNIHTGPRRGTTWPEVELILLFTGLFSATFSGQSFFYTFLFTGLQVKGVAFDFLDDVFLLHLALEAAQGIFQRLTFLDSYFRQFCYTPRPVRLD